MFALLLSILALGGQSNVSFHEALHTSGGALAGASPEMQRQTIAIDRVGTVASIPIRDSSSLLERAAIKHELMRKVDKTSSSAHVRIRRRSDLKNATNLHSVNMEQEGPRPTSDRNHRILALRESIAALNAAGVDFVAAYGTLLGLVRDGTVLEHDDNVAIFASANTFYLVSEALRNLERPVSIKWGGIGFLRASAPNWGPLDVHTFHPVVPLSAKNSWELQLGCDDWNQVVMATENVFPAKLFRPTGLLGLEVPVPEEAAQFLQEFYGPDWHIPILVHCGGTRCQTPRNGTLHAQWQRLCNPLRLQAGQLMIHKCTRLMSIPGRAICIVTHSLLALFVCIMISIWAISCFWTYVVNPNARKSPGDVAAFKGST